MNNVKAQETSPSPFRTLTQPPPPLAQYSPGAIQVGTGRGTQGLQEGKEAPTTPIAPSNESPATGPLPSVNLMLSAIKAVDSEVVVTMNELWQQNSDPEATHAQLRQDLLTASNCAKAAWFQVVEFHNSGIAAAGNHPTEASLSCGETLNTLACLSRELSRQISAQKQGRHILQISLQLAHRAHRLYRFTEEALQCTGLLPTERIAYAEYLELLLKQKNLTIKLSENAIGLVIAHRDWCLELERRIRDFHNLPAEDTLIAAPELKQAYDAHHTGITTALGTILEQMTQIVKFPKNSIEKIFTLASDRKRDDPSGFYRSQTNLRAAQRTLHWSAACSHAQATDETNNAIARAPSNEDIAIVTRTMNAPEAYRAHVQRKGSPLVNYPLWLPHITQFGSQLSYFFEFRISALRCPAIDASTEEDALTLLMNTYASIYELSEQVSDQESEKIRQPG